MPIWWWSPGFLDSSWLRAWLRCICLECVSKFRTTTQAILLFLNGDVKPRNLFSRPHGPVDLAKFYWNYYKIHVLHFGIPYKLDWSLYMCSRHFDLCTHNLSNSELEISGKEIAITICVIKFRVRNFWGRKPKLTMTWPVSRWYIVSQIIWKFVLSKFQNDRNRQVAFCSTNTEDSDQTRWIPRQIWVFTGRGCFLMVLSFIRRFPVTTKRLSSTNIDLRHISIKISYFPRNKTCWDFTLSLSEGDFSLLLIISANSLDPEQDR